MKQFKIGVDKLPKAFKKKWLKALRSGKYEQAREMLIETDDDNLNPKYCCLGLACAIQHPKLAVQDKGTIVEGCLPIPLNKVRVPNILKGKYTDNPVVTKLVDLNDTDGCSFREIANWVSKNL